MGRGITWLIFGVVAGFALAACGGTSATSDGSSTSNVAVCPPLPDGGMASIGIGPDESVASGTLVGSAVNCSICDVGAGVFVLAVPDGGPPAHITLGLSNTASGGDTCAIPNVAYNPMFQANIDLNDIQPGTYSSSQATSNSCTSLGLEYNTSTTPDCQWGRGPVQLPRGVPSLRLHRD